MRFPILTLIAVLASTSPASAAAVARQERPAAAMAGLQVWLARPEAERQTDDPALARPLAEADAARVLEMLTAARRAALAAADHSVIAAKVLRVGDKTLKWEARVFGEAPPGGRSLWISMHGGGNAPPAVNDGQWRNQIRLYEPAEGIYLAPRAPTDTWNLWHEPHIDGLFQRLIDAEVAVNGVNPDKVYLLGYSAGGDGVWQLAPRMADRFAAAAMMAGHPGDASLLPLRNLPFALFMGGADGAYDRNRHAAEKTGELARLHAVDPGGYTYVSRIYPGLPHWMDRKDAEALPWMARFTRDPWPKRVVWVQDDVPHDRFYWLRIGDAAQLKTGGTIVATVAGQGITIEGDVPAGLTLRLCDRLVDLDRPVRVTVNGRVVFAGTVSRTAGAIWRSLEERFDPSSAATALLTLP